MHAMLSAFHPTDIQQTDTVGMKPITLEYLKLSVAKGFDPSASTFTALRQAVATDAGVKEQYFGLSDNGKNELIWILSWSL